jgi:pyrroline-5-carboxylate reductase
MNGSSDFSQPPRDVPLFVKYLLGLSSDASRQEIEQEWTNQVVPLMNVGPSHLFDTLANSLMAAGIPGDQARRLFKKTNRGQKLLAAVDREGKIRARKTLATPPFLKGKLQTL